MSCVTAGKALMPAGAWALHSSLPEAVEYAYTLPVKSEVNTTSFATVAAPKSACGSLTDHLTVPDAASKAVRPPVAVAKFCAGTLSEVAEPTAQRSSHGT